MKATRQLRGMSLGSCTGAVWIHILEVAVFRKVMSLRGGYSAVSKEQPRAAGAGKTPLW